MYLIRDPEIFKQIAIKDFESFEDRRFFLNPEVDSLFGNSILCLSGRKWHDMRATLSPAFTGYKMRLMFELVRDCALNTTKHFKELLRNENAISVEMTDIFSRYSTDVIASCSFGHNVDSFNDKTNEFFMCGRKISETTSLSQAIKFFVQNFAPKLMKMLKIEYFDADIRKFISTMVLDSMHHRRVNGINRPDMIDILMKAQDGTLVYQDDMQPQLDGFATVEESGIGKRKVNRKWSDIELISQSFLFFLAGYDTITSALLASAYELALNPEVQEKLSNEIKMNERNLNGKSICYDDLQKLKYLDMVVSEVLRIRPTATLLDRVCGRDYELQMDERKLKICKGTQLWIPVYGYHHDPKYFSNPEKFDPERFNDENKANFNTASYIPFGQGPRNCIASRFALMEMKVQLYFLLKDFSLEVNSKTDIPMKIKPTMVGVYPKNGLHLSIKLRQ